jgi:hypothetical protein
MAKEFGDFADEIGVPESNEQEHYTVKVERNIEGRFVQYDVSSVRFEHSDKVVVIEVE